jgi:NIMA (never in mitosis gene a)-related kinase
VRQEADLLSRLDHPNIIRHIENFEQSGYLYIAMEYADGGDLSSRISSESHMDEKTVLTVFCQVCLGLDYLHSHRILHRDIKPMNVFLMKDGTVKLGDFGIARLLPERALARSQVGTPAYLAPELWTGKRYDSKADVWSLGCLLYELCTNHTPFEASNVGAICAKVLKGRFPAISGPYSLEMGRLVGRMLAQHPNDRPSAKQILRMPLLKRHFMALSKPVEHSMTPRARSRPRSNPDDSGPIRPITRTPSPAPTLARQEHFGRVRAARSPTPPPSRGRHPLPQKTDERPEHGMVLPPAIRQSILDALLLPPFDGTDAAEEGFHEDE